MSMPDLDKAADMTPSIVTRLEEGGSREADLYERGNLVWHTSEEDGCGPDVGASVGLGEGRMLYAGEVANATLRENGVDPDEHAASWHLVVFGQDSTEIIASVIDSDRAVNLLTEIAPLLSYGGR